MNGDKKRWRPGRGGCGCFTGCGSFIFVFLLGGALSLFGAVCGLGVSVGVPFTQNNLTLAGSIGAKDKVTTGLPSYTEGRLAGNQNFINQSGTLTVGPAEGVYLFVVGAQPGAPAIDLHLYLR
jgi:hypothetical protein